ncbi:hypothetical protein [Clostridium sp. HBUAS56010]|uniref:hypothetical protein n=1 Tax=Clostridium sp. HBUAS56010 TaxID=2571127 RepID=UPI001177B97A|nr:hypothetical protein [Clostridium sp. HBUAS56010]
MEDLTTGTSVKGKYYVRPASWAGQWNSEGKLVYGNTLFESENKTECTEYLNRYTLIKLIKENPELPVLPMVAYEVCAGDDFAYWGGSWGAVKIDSYFIDDERVVYKSEDEPEIVVEKAVGHDAFMKMTDEEVKEAWENLPWIKAIVVHIELP